MSLFASAWLRKFVSSHPAYKGDSFINQEIAYDLMMTCKGIGEGSIACPELLGSVIIDRSVILLIEIVIEWVLMKLIVFYA
jgi:hypothetical protein